MRAALLPLSGDPIVAAFWMKFFPIWKDEVDRLYAYLNAPFILPDDPLVEFYKNLFDLPNITFVSISPYGDHGPGLTRMVNDSKEEEIMFIEEDAFVYGHGIITSQFEKLKEFDFLGSPRGSAHQNIYNSEVEKWGAISIGYDSGPNFWPNFFFVKRDLLLKTDLHFGAKNWKVGETIKELNLTVQESSSIDTFGWIAIQLRTLSDKVGYIPQNKAYAFSPDTFDKSYPWIHAGSLSSGTVYYLRDKNNIPLQNGDKNKTYITPDKLKSDAEVMEYSMRVAWWELALESTEKETESISEYRINYREALTRYIEEFQLPRWRIESYKTVYKRIML